MHQFEKTFQLCGFFCFLGCFMNFLQLSCKSSFLIFQSCNLLCVGSNLGIYFGNLFVQYFYFGTSLSHMKPPDKILLLIQ